MVGKSLKTVLVLVLLVTTTSLILRLERAQQLLSPYHRYSESSPATTKGFVNLYTSPHPVPHPSPATEAVVPPKQEAVPVIPVTASSVELTIWKNAFCQDFVINSYDDHLPMCGGKVAESDQVKCSGNARSDELALCSYKNLAIRPQQMMSVIPNDRIMEEPPNKTITLLQSADVSCGTPSMRELSKKTNRDKIEVKMTQHLLESEKLLPSVCDVWVNKTAFFHVSNSLHIYFRFLDLYNVHKAILDSEFESREDHLVLRIGNMKKDYRFPEFDKALFPGAMTLADLKEDATYCFKNVVLVPRSYQSIPFRCKMEPSIRKRCFECDGKGLTGSPLYTFRTRVLQACRIVEPSNKTSNLVIVLRKPYKRWSTDDPKRFHRILLNEDEMVSKIRKTFPRVTVHVIHMEDLGVCEQVQYAVRADVMLGVHGAGLVHFWWLRDDATAIELEPSFESGNPSFKMLTKLAGRNYMSEKVSGSSNVTVKVDQLLSRLEQLFLAG